jgi:hypothetical protein
LYEGLPLIGASFLFAILSVSLVARKIGRVWSDYLPLFFF